MAYAIKYLPTLSADRRAAQVIKDEVRGQLNEARNKQARIPILRGDIDRFESEIRFTRKEITPKFRLEPLLADVSQSAEEKQIVVKAIVPGEAKVLFENEDRFEALPLTLSLSGSYGAVARLLDGVIHRNQDIQVHSIQLRHATTTPDDVSFANPEVFADIEFQLLRRIPLT